MGGRRETERDTPRALHSRRKTCKARLGEGSTQPEVKGLCIYKRPTSRGCFRRCETAGLVASVYNTAHI